MADESTLQEETPRTFIILDTNYDHQLLGGESPSSVEDQLHWKTPACSSAI